MLAAVRFHAALNWWIFCSFVIRRHELLFFPFFWISLKMLLSLLSRNSCFMADTWNILKAKSVLLKFIWVMLVYWRKHNDRLPLTHHMYICEPFFLFMWTWTCSKFFVIIRRFSFHLRFCVGKFKMMIK